MRVVAGAAKGRRLSAPPGDDVRPTADRVKEALFSSLQQVIPGARVLDLYAGSGSLGLEALSRGATSATFVERDRRSVEHLHRNIEVVGLPGAIVLATSVDRTLAEPIEGEPFDLVLADPPYRTPKAEVAAVLEQLVPHLAPGATVVIERSVRDGSPAWPAGFERGDARRYGDTAIHRAQLTSEGS